MPAGIDKAPKTLPEAAKKRWIGTFNGVFDSCDGPEKECDQRAARIAWSQIRKDYRKVSDKWIAKSEYDEAYHDVLLTITKASLQPDGSVRWQAVASDTGKDRAEERTSIELFQDWIDRITYKADIPYLPAPKMPFLGVSHYPALDGFGEAGVTRRMFIDGSVFKADGVFKADSAIGQKLLGAVKTELALIKKGDHPEKPIRISAGWWDIQHFHEDSQFLFTRQALTDKCPLCEKGQTSDKIYKAGQLDHFAATRVPMNPRTSLELEEKSMAITRRNDAESIIGSDDAEEMERRARMVGKSDTEGDDELHPAMVTKATKLGDFIKQKREAKDLTIAQLAAETPVSASTIGDLERGNIAKPSSRDLAALATALDVEQGDIAALVPEDEAETTKAGHMKPGEFLKNIRRKKKKDHDEIEKRAGFKRGRLKRIEDEEEDFPFEMMAKLVDALDMDDDEAEDFGRRFGKKRKAEHEDDEDKDEAPAKKGSKKEKLLDRFGSKRRKTPPKHKADIEKNGEYSEDMTMPIQPLGGATSMKDAQDFIETKEKFGKLHSFWDIFQAVVRNIMVADDEAVPDKVKAMGKAVQDLGGQIDTLKAGLSDAFLIQESAAAYEDYEDEVAEDNYEDYEDYEDEDENDEVNVMTTDIEHPADQLKAAVDLALENKTLSGTDRETAVQEAFDEYATGVQAQLVEADPASQADQIATAIKGALADVFTPLSEQVALLTAKMGSAAGPQPTQAYPDAPVSSGVIPLQEVYVPQQKSMMAPIQTPQPVQPAPGMPISPHTGKPSALTDKIRKSVGLVT